MRASIWLSLNSNYSTILSSHSDHQLDKHCTASYSFKFFLLVRYFKLASAFLRANISQVLKRGTFNDKAVPLIYYDLMIIIAFNHICQLLHHKEKDVMYALIPVILETWRRSQRSDFRCVGYKSEYWAISCECFFAKIVNIYDFLKAFGIMAITFTTLLG